MESSRVINDMGGELLAPASSVRALEGHPPPRENDQHPRRRRRDREDSDSRPDRAETPNHQLDRLG